MAARRTTHVPTEMEKLADADDLAIIRKLYGSRAQTLINTLLGFDAYFRWYYPYKRSIPLLAPLSVREERALDNARRAIDLHEITERVTIRNHKSFLFHGAIHKTSRDILEVGDVWRFNLSPLEPQNAETKRVAETGGSRRLTMTASGSARAPLKSKEGPARLVLTKGYSTTMALSTLNKLLAAQVLRSGDGVFSIPESRRKERLFGASGAGRTSTHISQ